MSRLGDLASLIRSKNAGPFQLTFDIMFDDADLYLLVKSTEILRAELFAKLYETPIAMVYFTTHDRALSFKVTIPRPVFQGEIGETDVFGCQQFDPIAAIEIPV